MKAGQRERARRRVGAHFIKRQLQVMTKEQRVFNGLRHQRPGQLLKAGSEKRGGLAALFRQVAGKNADYQAQGGFGCLYAADHAVKQRDIWRG